MGIVMRGLLIHEAFNISLAMIKCCSFTTNQKLTLQCSLQQSTYISSRKLTTKLFYSGGDDDDDDEEDEEDVM